MERWRQSLRMGRDGHESHPDEKTLPGAVQRTIEWFLFQRMCQARGLETSEWPGVELPAERGVGDVLREPVDAEPARTFLDLPPETLGRVYEHFLDRSARGDGAAGRMFGRRMRRAGGIYYTPGPIVDHVVRLTIGLLRPDLAPRILDPACGGGFFLLSAYRMLLRTWADRPGAAGLDQRLAILRRCIHGVDIDSQAVEVTRRSLLLEALDDGAAGRPSAALQQAARAILVDNIRCGDAIVGPDYPADAGAPEAIDWPAAFPDVLQADPPGFDAVVGNPPWGQKAVLKDGAIWAYLRSRYRSLGGIADVFRPFVERAVTLVRPGGVWGMVLPDIVLLKDYVQTRRLLLDELSLAYVDWWGKAFPSASIDVATLIGRRSPAPPGHRVQVHLRERGVVKQHTLGQEDFRRNERLTFNLHLTPERREILDHLSRFPTLGRLCEIHEGVHSGNIRRELFVDRPVDASCRPLLFGRDEIAPYELVWRGKLIRLSALPRSRTPDRYANAGQPAWHEREKLLVRRTGDFVLAAVDRQQRYASNNFFIVFLRAAAPLTLDGLAALLNSPLICWFFRCIEPRPGRAFAELKIKHLRRFPVPPETADPRRVRRLNDLGARRARLAQEQRRVRDEIATAALNRNTRRADQQIGRLVLSLFGLGQDQQERILHETRAAPTRRRASRSFF